MGGQRMEHRKRFMTVAILAAAAALLAVPATQAASNHSLQGGGTTTQLLCSSGVAVPATIQLNAQKSKGFLQGSFFVSAGAGFLSGNLNSGTINSGSYSLSGVVNGACGGATHLFPG